MMFTDAHNRVWGEKDIARMTEITSSNNSIQFTVGDVDYTATIPTGTYETIYTRHTSDLINVINQEFEDNLILIDAYLGRVHKNIKYSSVVFRSSGGEEITSISGTFVDAFM